MSHKNISESGLDEKRGLLETNIDINGSKEKSEKASIAKKSFGHKGNELGSKVGVFSAMLTIVGTIIGGGIVGIPFATLQTGIWLVLVVHTLNFIWGIYSVHLLLEAKDISGLSSFFGAWVLLIRKSFDFYY